MPASTSAEGRTPSRGEARHHAQPTWCWGGFPQDTGADPSTCATGVLIRGRVLDAINNKNVDGSCCRLQSEAELLVQRLKEGGFRILKSGRWLSRIGRHNPLHAKVKRTGETRSITHWPIHTGKRIHQEIG